MYQNKSSLPVFLFLIYFFNTTFVAAEVLCAKKSSRSALVIIDMQPGFQYEEKVRTKPDNLKKFESVLAEQVKAIQKARFNNLPIIFIEYGWPDHDLFGHTYSELKTAVNNYKFVKYFQKSDDSMFSVENKNRKALIDFLQLNGIGTLIIMGANGGACVKESIQDALNGGCKVTAYLNGIIDFNYKNYIYPYESYQSLVTPKNEALLREYSDLTFLKEKTLGLDEIKNQKKEIDRSGVHQ